MEDQMLTDIAYWVPPTKLGFVPNNSFLVEPQSRHVQSACGATKSARAMDQESAWEDWSALGLLEEGGGGGGGLALPPGLQRATPRADLPWLGAKDSYETQSVQGILASLQCKGLEVQQEMNLAHRQSTTDQKQKQQLATCIARDKGVRDRILCPKNQHIRNCQHIRRHQSKAGRV
jgi:hypothetical protein